MFRYGTAWRVVSILFIIVFLMALRPLKALVWEEASPGDRRLCSAENSTDLASQSRFSDGSPPHPDETCLARPLEPVSPVSPFSPQSISRAPPFHS